MTLPELFAAIPAWTDGSERELLTSLAAAVPADGLILEIGALYGGTTAVLATGAPHARVTSIDNFSWQPEGYPKPSAELVRENLSKVGVKNVTVIKGDSRVLCKTWNKHIDLLWVDGGHSFEFVYNDIFTFGQFADVIALHDFDNPAWTTIRKAVETFIDKFPEWHVDTVVGMVVVLRKQ